MIFCNAIKCDILKICNAIKCDILKICNPIKCDILKICNAIKCDILKQGNAPCPDADKVYDGKALAEQVSVYIWEYIT